MAAASRLTPTVDTSDSAKLKWLLQQIGWGLQHTGVVGKGPNAPINVVVNPSFEDSTYGWRLTVANGGAAAFTATVGNSRFGVTKAELAVSAFDGIDDIVFINTVSEPNAAAENKSIPVAASTVYRVSMWSRVASGTGDIALGIVTWDAAGAPLTAYSSSTITVLTDWVRTTFTFTTDATAAFASVRVSALTLNTFYVDGVQLSSGVDDYPFDHPIHNVATADNVAVGSLIGFAAATLGADVVITADNTWTDIVSVTLPLSHNTEDVTALITLNTFLYLDETAGTGDMEVEWRLLRNGVVVRTSGISVSTVDAIIDGTATVIDTAITASEVVVEYRFQVLKDDNGGTWTSEVRRPCALVVQLFKD